MRALRARIRCRLFERDVTYTWMTREALDEVVFLDRRDGRELEARNGSGAGIAPADAFERRTEPLQVTQYPQQAVATGRQFRNDLQFAAVQVQCACSAVYDKIILVWRVGLCLFFE